MRGDPDDIYILAKKRVFKAIRRGDFPEANRWTNIAERIHRMDFRFSDNLLRYEKHRLAEKEREARIAQMQAPPRRYP